MNGLGQKAASFVYIGALFLFVTLFGPYAIYAANDGEFQSSFAALVPSLLNWHIGFGLLAIGVVRRHGCGVRLRAEAGGRCS